MTTGKGRSMSIRPQRLEVPSCKARRKSFSGQPLKNSPKPHKTSQKTEDHKGSSVSVVVRTRAFLAHEVEAGETFPFTISGETEIVIPKKWDGKTRMTFDRVFGPNSSQENVYDKISPLVTCVLKGYSGTILAYGQTNSGKTYTMTGSKQKPGILGRVIHQFFEHQKDDERQIVDESVVKQHLIHVCMLEVYNERVRDLLRKSGDKFVEVREHPDHGFFVKGLTKQIVTNEQHALNILVEALKCRTVAKTAHNDASSRSHLLFTVCMEISTVIKICGKPNKTVLVSKMNLVDLAGSECLTDTVSKEMETESKNINKSLTCLTVVINKLASAEGHVPYRNSKLTMLLRDSLGGNSQTLMIATLSPCLNNLNESRNTLRYAQRTKMIKNKPNIKRNPKDAILQQLSEEVVALKKQLADQEAQLFSFVIGSKPLRRFSQGVHSSNSLNNRASFIQLQLDLRQKMREGKSPAPLSDQNVKERQRMSATTIAKMEQRRSLPSQAVSESKTTKKEFDRRRTVSAVVIQRQIKKHLRNTDKKPKMKPISEGSKSNSSRRKGVSIEELGKKGMKKEISVWMRNNINNTDRRPSPKSSLKRTFKQPAIPKQKREKRRTESAIVIQQQIRKHLSRRKTMRVRVRRQQRPRRDKDTRRTRLWWSSTSNRQSMTEEESKMEVISEVSKLSVNSDDFLLQVQNDEVIRKKIDDWMTKLRAGAKSMEVEMKKTAKQSFNQLKTENVTLDKETETQKRCAEQLKEIIKSLRREAQTQAVDTVIHKQEIRRLKSDVRNELLEVVATKQAAKLHEREAEALGQEVNKHHEKSEKLRREIEGIAAESISRLKLDVRRQKFEAGTRTTQVDNLLDEVQRLHEEAEVQKIDAANPQQVIALKQEVEKYRKQLKDSQQKSDQETILAQVVAAQEEKLDKLKSDAIKQSKKLKEASNLKIESLNLKRKLVLCKVEAETQNRKNMKLREKNTRLAEKLNEDINLLTRSGKVSLSSVAPSISKSVDTQAGDEALSRDRVPGITQTPTSVVEMEQNIAIDVSEDEQKCEDKELARRESVAAMFDELKEARQQKVDFVLKSAMEFQRQNDIIRSLYANIDNLHQQMSPKPSRWSVVRPFKDTREKKL